MLCEKIWRCLIDLITLKTNSGKNYFQEKIPCLKLGEKIQEIIKKKTF